MEILVQIKHHRNDIFDVLFFIEGWYDDYFFQISKYEWRNYKLWFKKQLIYIDLIQINYFLKIIG